MNTCGEQSRLWLFFDFGCMITFACYLNQRTIDELNGNSLHKIIRTRVILFDDNV